MNALNFITTTRGVATTESGRSPTGDHQLAVVGYRRQRERVYFLESYASPAETSALFSMNLTGQYAGRTVPVRSAVNENLDRDAAGRERLVMERLADLAALLRPLRTMPADSLELSTRVVRRSALVLGTATVPVRKFVLKVAIGGTGEHAAARQHYISTYLRPRVTLARAFEIPNRSQAIAILSYIGLPYGLGDRIEQPVLVDLTT